MSKPMPITFDDLRVSKILDGSCTSTFRPIDFDSPLVVPRCNVGADWPMMVDPKGELSADAGDQLRGGMNGQGAVHALMDNEKTLGLRPNEFDFICPYVEQGETFLVDAEPPVSGRPPSVRRRKWIVVPRTPTRLWVAEPWCRHGGLTTYQLDGDWIESYRASDDFKPHDNPKWRPASEMPEDESRIRLQVVLATAERLPRSASDVPVADDPETPSLWMWKVDFILVETGSTTHWGVVTFGGTKR